MAEKKLTAAQKRDRDMAALIAGVQKEYEDKIQLLKAQQVTELATTATENYLLGWDQGVKTTEATYKAQSFIDRLMGHPFLVRSKYDKD